MARTHKTHLIKARMAEEARKEEEARAANAARTAKAAAARTRSEKARVVARAAQDRAHTYGPHIWSDGEDEDFDDDEVVDGQEPGQEPEQGLGQGLGQEAAVQAQGVGRQPDNGSAGTTEMFGHRRQGKKRRAEAVEDEEAGQEDADEGGDDKLVDVPPFEVEHDLWAVFEGNLKAYMARTRQVLVVKELINICRRNESIRKQVKNRGLQDNELLRVPAAMEPYQRKIICTHGWPVRERSQGKRTSRHLRRTGCPFQMLAQVTQRDDGSWGITVKREIYSHNHSVSSQIYKHYPSNRQVSQDSPLMPGIRLLVDAEVSPTRIYDYIHASSEHLVTLTDVRNLIQRLRSSGAQISDDDAVAEMVVNFNLASSLNVAAVNERARGNTGVISFTTAHMWSMLDSFPEVLQMDCTHKTNKYNYQLLSMVGIDQFRHGQPVQYSLLETTTDWHMGKALDHFKRANDHWRFVRVVIVDKDMREVDVIRRKLPKARILLCHFHVMKWLHERIRKSSKYGAYSDDVLAQMRHSITNMMHAKTDADCKMHRDEFKHLAGRNGRNEMWTYFQHNWDSVCKMWVMAHRTDLPHFKNHTNNRVESLFSKVKQHVKGRFTMKSILEALLRWQRRKEEDYKAVAEMPGTLRDTSYTEEMNVVLGMTTRWVAAAIKTQYDIAMNPEQAAKYLIDASGDFIMIRRGEHEYLLEKESLACDCTFSKTMQLPCRHAMVYRISSGSVFVIPFGAIESKWFGQSRLLTDKLSEPVNPFMAKVYTKDATTTDVTMTEREKYRRAQQTFGRISGELAQFGDEDFECAMDQFDLWWHNLRQGRLAMVEVEMSGNKYSSVDDGDAVTSRGSGQRNNDGSIQNKDDNGFADNSPAPTAISSPIPTEQEQTPAPLPKIRLNGHAPKVGRPRVNRQEQRLKAQAALKDYNHGMKLRALLREKDVCEVSATLKKVRPGLREVGSFMATFPVNAKPVGKSLTWRSDGDDEFVPCRVQFLLPEPTVDRALDTLTRNAKDNQIELDSEGRQESSSSEPVVYIEKVGTFTRSQVQNMKWLWNLQDLCRKGAKCCTWLNGTIKRLGDDPSRPSGVFEEMVSSWPYARLPGFSFDITYSDLYRFSDSTWLNDNAMCAFSVFLDRYNNNVTITLPPPAAVNEKAVITGDTLDKIRVACTKHRFVLLPINLSNAHWCCLVVDSTSKTVHLYDSKAVNSKPRVLKRAAKLICSTLGNEYAELNIEEPQQKDNDSCGVFVCLYFWNCVSSEAPCDVSPLGISKLRWTMLDTVLKTINK